MCVRFCALVRSVAFLTLAELSALLPPMCALLVCLCGCRVRPTGLSMTLCSQQVCLAGSCVLSHSFMSPAIFEHPLMLCAHLHMFGVPAWFLDWARLHLSALTCKLGILIPADELGQICNHICAVVNGWHVPVPLMCPASSNAICQYYHSCLAGVYHHQGFCLTTCLTASIFDLHFCAPKAHLVFHCHKFFLSASGALINLCCVIKGTIVIIMYK